jgi:hypothetical protein
MLTVEEIDIVNVLMHIIEKHDNIKQPSTNEIELGITRCITTNLHEIAALLGFKELKVQPILTMLDNITKNVASIFYSTDEGRQLEKVCFLNKYAITSSKNSMNKRITLWINVELINVFKNNLVLFKQLYNHARYELKSKYSKLIYDYFSNRGGNTAIFTVEEFSKLMDFDLITSEWDWSRLNSNILKRASKEINDKTNMNLEYVKTKTNNDGRVKTTSVEFNYYIAKETPSEEYEYFNEDILSTRRLEYYIEKHVIDKYSTIVRFKDKNAIVNPEAYKDKLRRESLRDRAEFEAKIDVQEWSNIIKYEHTEKDGLVGLINYEDRHFVTINNNYKIYDPSTETELTTSARDTMNKIIEYFNQDTDTHGYTINEDYSIYPIKTFNKCSISYSKG